ncbi:hypothetical protein ACFVUH_24155 [Kitasatospora sp. NPDC058032]|uniref:hypothetical protein n=1 Tax=Kitasatospora sp. NPDC058032 TaxID=3346307 RepID=UPI0036DA10D6
MALGKKKQDITRRTDTKATANKKKQGADKGKLLDKFWDKSKGNGDDDEKKD